MNDDWLKEFHGPNAGYILELYERYQENPDSVSEEARSLFERWSPDGGDPDQAGAPARMAERPSPSAVVALRITAAANLAQAIRSFGHLAARLDPLGSPPPGDPWLDPAFHGIRENELEDLPAEVVGGPVSEDSANALEAIEKLRAVYANSIGYDYSHIRIPEERDWLRHAAECGRFRPPDAPVDRVGLLDRLIRVEAFETFLHRIFPGKTRFSIEGVDMLVPMIDELMGCSAEEEICSILIGMAHRGRLNVLAHNLGMPYTHILAEFLDPTGNFSTRNEMGWTGDVKYHKGARRAVTSDESVQMVASMAPNPSHLEHVNPVIMGMARAADTKVDAPGPPEFFSNASLPVLIHGDASFMGQGVVAETLNLSQLSGYSVGGTVHIIANNQLGYTTTSGEGRSTFYASDLAKGHEIPIIHCNADDPIACLEAVRTAFAYRQEFGKDFLIDLIGYRRYGHNEGDEPTFTQPLMYQTISEHPSIRNIWAKELIENREIDAQEPERRFQAVMSELQGILEELQPEGGQELESALKPQLEAPPRGAARRVRTAVSLDRLKAFNQALRELPEGFNVHRKLARAMKRRRQIFEDVDQATIDWATAEELAFASILADGTPIRLSGEDVARGTFSHRHAVFHDTVSGETHTPLQALPQAKASFEVINSPLSENAVLGFEYGYNVLAPDRLVVWEAQYGDFINAGQAMIDEFIVSARAKWEQTPSLVLLLPHGHEGQGPDHSSGRPERFLQLAADTNMRIANCTTAAQYFHLLRRQAALLKTDPLPLIVMTPKSLLRHPRVASSPRELAEGNWQPVIDDPRHPPEASRLILCSGKIFVDLATSEEGSQAEIAIARIEQFYPFPQEEVSNLLEAYPNLREVVWVQEEPANMGAWDFIRPRLFDLIDSRLPLHYVGRPASSSPAEGFFAWHTANQTALIREALQCETRLEKEG